MSIRHMLTKLKSFARSEQSFMAGLLCLVGVSAFLLGQVSVESSQNQLSAPANEAGIIFIDAPEPALPANAITVVASSGGTKYHRLDCPGANSINQENKIYFDSVELAKAAGYTPAANCDF